MADKKKERVKLVTPEFRGSFAHLNKPRAFGNSEPKYSITMVLDEDDPFWDKLEAACKEVAERRWEKLPRNLKLPIRHGSETDNDDWEGKKFCQFSSEERPGVVDAELEDVVDRSEIYSGAWYRCSIRPYAWHYPETNKKGVSIQLDNVMKVRDDEAFSGRASATDDFAGFVDGDGRDEDDEPAPRSRRRRRAEPGGMLD